jgi:serine/threonine protein kinase/Flp pilus assembly protein TadD
MQTIGNYHIIDKIGEGGMGIVYKAQDAVLERIVAIKALRPLLLADANMKARFIREAKILAKLSHPNIVTLYTLLQDEGRLYLVMEYAEGKTLKAILGESGAMTFVQYLGIFQQVLEGVGYAHAKGIIHRDIKPGNVIVTQRGTVKITDFGIAKVPGDLRMTASGTRMGTIPYMSPEQINGKDPDFVSDIYSLGVTLYEMVTGRTPFRADSEYTLMKLIVEQDAPSPREFCPSVPPHIEKAVMESLSKSPADRFQSADEFREAIEPAAEVKTSFTDRTEPNIEIFRDEDHKPEIAQERKPHTRRWTAWPVYSAVILLLVGLAFVLIQRQASGPGLLVGKSENPPPSAPTSNQKPTDNPKVEAEGRGPYSGKSGPANDSQSRNRGSIAARHIKEGQRQYRDGNYMKAKEAFRQAQAADPGNREAAESLKKVQAAMEAEGKVDASSAKRGPLRIDEVEMLVSGQVHPDRIVKIISEQGVVFPATDANLKRLVEAYKVPVIVTDTIKEVAQDQEKRKIEQVEKFYHDGVEAFRNGRFTEALDLFTAVTQLKPDHAKAHFYRGRCYAALREFDAAIHSYKQAVRLTPDYQDAFLYMGVAYSVLKSQQEAIEAYKVAARIGPARGSVYYYMGIAYGKLGMHSHEEIESYRQAVNIAPDRPEFWTNLAVAYDKVGRYKEAEKAWESAIRARLRLREGGQTQGGQ